MAHIKVPYQYVSYPFSEEATRLSQNLSKNKRNVQVVVTFVVYSLIIALLAQLFRRTNMDTEGFRSLIPLLLPLIGAVPCGIYAERLRTRWYHRKIREALTEDLSAMFPGDSETVQTALAQLTKDFTDIPKDK